MASEDVDMGGGAGAAGGAGGDYDAELYNRQLYVMGRDAQARMAASAVFISGMRGVGIEIGEWTPYAGVGEAGHRHSLPAAVQRAHAFTRMVVRLSSEKPRSHGRQVNHNPRQ